MSLQEDEQGDEILIDPRTLLVPSAIWAAVLRAVNATTVESFDPTAATQVRQVSPSPFPKGQFNVVTSPLIDRIVTAGDWFLGNFKDQFWYKEVFPFQTMAAKEGHEDEFDRDVKFKYKVREKGDVGAVDHVHCYKNQTAAL